MQDLSEIDFCRVRGGNGDRLWAVLETQRKLSTEYQSVILNRQEVVEQAAAKWDHYIRYTFSGSSDFGDYMPVGSDTILTANGNIAHVVGLGGQTVSSWSSAQTKGGGSTYLHKAW